MKADELKTKILTRIDELVAQIKEGKDNRIQIESAFMGALNLMQMVYGNSSPQVKSLMESKKTWSRGTFAESYEIESLGYSVGGALLNLKSEIEAGLTRNLVSEIAASVIGDFVALAKGALREGNLQVAAVLATAALEDTLKRKAEEQGLNVEGKTLDSVVNALKGKGFFTGAQAPIVSSYVKLRNSAMHADWSKIQSADVGSLIGFLEPFLVQQFR